MLSVVYSTSPYSMSVVILLYFTLTSCCCKVVCIKCEHSVINAAGPRAKDRKRKPSEMEYFKSDATCKVLVAFTS